MPAGQPLVAGIHSAVRLTVRTGSLGAAEYEMQHQHSPAASPRRQTSPTKPVKKTSRRVQFAAAEPADVRVFDVDSEETDCEAQQEERGGIRRAANGIGTGSSQTWSATGPGSPGWHSPPQPHYMPNSAPSTADSAAVYGLPPQAASMSQLAQLYYVLPAHQQHVYAPSEPSQPTTMQQPMPSSPSRLHDASYQHQQAEYAQVAAMAASAALAAGLPPRGIALAVDDDSGDTGAQSPTKIVAGHQHLQVLANSISITVSSPRVQLSTVAARGGFAGGEWPQQEAASGVQQQQPQAGEAAAAVPQARLSTTLVATQTDAAADSLPASHHPGQLASAQLLPAEMPQCNSGHSSQQQQQQQCIPAAALSQWERRYSGAASSWGRLQAERDGGVTGGSLGSGLSPCEARQRPEEWVQSAALRALADGADSYGHTVRQQSRGRPAGLSASDALPSRLAAQQLGSLAGMSRKVQEAIQHSQHTFERQAVLVEQAVLARAFYVQRRHAVLVARHHVEKGQLRRCLHAWRRQCGSHDAQQQALHRAWALLLRGLLRRCWQEWRRQCTLRWWKVQVDLRDLQVQLLGTQLRHLESRPVHYMARLRMRRVLAAWQQATWHQQAKRAVLAAAARHAARTAISPCFGGWQAVAVEKAAHQHNLRQAGRLLGRLQLRHALAAWQDQVGCREAKRQSVAVAEQLQQLHLLKHVLGGWRYIAWFKQAARTAQQRRQLTMLASTYAAWWQQTALAAATAALLAECAHVSACRLVACTFGHWQAYVEGRRARQQAEELESLTSLLRQLAAESEQLKRDNERLCRVIDSGDWGRQRVQELLQAGQVLQGERDALAQLVGSLQQQRQQQQPSAGVSSPLHDATNSLAAGQLVEGLLQQFQVSAASIQPVMTGNGTACLIPAQRPAGCGQGSAGDGLRPGSRSVSPAAARNKMLVRTGSSFNAMVRALKQDLLTSGALQRSPDVLYEVDKLSLNRLSVAVANGGGAEVVVQAVRSPDHCGVAFGTAYPPSPKRHPMAAVAAGKGAKAGGPVDPALRQSGSSLLAAALRLQGIGGRSVGLQKGGK